MRTTFALAAFAGAALAAPQYGGNAVYQTHMIVETVVQTVYVTEAYDATTTTPAYYAPEATTTVVYEAPPSSYEAPVEPTSTYVAQPTYEAPAYVAPTPEAQPSPSPAPAPAPAPANDYMGIMNQWRAKLGKPAFTYSKTLEDNALKTVTDSQGAPIHELNPGSFAQVMAPGSADNFEYVFVGGWLCEAPNMAGLDGACSKQSEGWSYDHQTDHAEICSNDGYKEAGCALNFGMWACDFA
jgi:hypothetical protein